MRCLVIGYCERFLADLAGKEEKGFSQIAADKGADGRRFLIEK
ncbi:MAG: hypothetical protein AVDCRST_MAG56-7898 [uncultured Cytophagales bacterium]|uniref:Uncharacterized protein n=1 Tax=uncultured Cytophagales bacterium TaxID=158755 RepID=A0A6J4LRC1_9SPHI|nr:MAG: hypothetical protein AVDCRST_MAG56-7898 [uncultured Cytophagales bacterium]